MCCCFHFRGRMRGFFLLYVYFTEARFSMIRLVNVVAAAGLAAIVFFIPASAQQTRGAASTQRPDAVVDGLKFHSVGGFVQIVDVANSQNAGTIILPPNQAPVFAAMPGYDARIKAAWEKYSKGETGTTDKPAETSSSTTAAPSNPVSASSNSPGFDASNKTLTMADGRTVSFVDDKNLTVKVPGIAGMQTYTLEYHGTGVRRLGKTMATTNRGYVGQSVFGTGVTITLESANGLPGGQLYDTADGANIPAPITSRIKPIIDAVREASDAVKADHPDLAKSQVVKSLLANNFGLK